MPVTGLTDIADSVVLVFNPESPLRKKGGEMRRNPVPLDDAATSITHGKYFSRAEALKISERSHQMCSAAMALADKTERLVEASRRLQQVCRELLRDAEMLTARVNHGPARIAKEPSKKR